MANALLHVSLVNMTRIVNEQCTANQVANPKERLKTARLLGLQGFSWLKLELYRFASMRQVVSMLDALRFSHQCYNLQEKEGLFFTTRFDTTTNSLAASTIKLEGDHQHQGKDTSL